MESADKNIR